MVVAGLGLMGSAYAERLAEKGFNVSLWSHRRGAAEELAKRIGASIASDEDLRSADVVIVAGWDDDYLLEIARRAADGTSVLVNAETVTPRASIEAGRIVGRRRYVEAPVAAGPGVARKGKLPVIVAYWEREAWGKAKPVIEALAATIIEVGEPPRAMVVKLAFNNILFTTVAGVAQSIGLLSAWGIDPDILRRLMESTWMKVIVERYWERGLRGVETHFRIEGAAKDLMYAVEAAYERGRSLPLSYSAYTLYTECARRLGGRIDYTRVMECEHRGE